MCLFCKVNSFQHIALYIASDENTEELLKLIMAGRAFDFAKGLEKETTALFSMYTIRQFVKAELLHDHFEVNPVNGHSLATSSSGEQRKALLQHLLSGNPSVIIADNVFESLDRAGQLAITQTLTGIATDTLIIQLIYRKKDCLPFIERVVTIKNNRIVKQQSREDFLQAGIASSFFTGSIPPPLKTYEIPGDVLVKMENLSVKFNDRLVLQQINWEIRKGDYWQLTGPNGSGKTTLLSLITGDSEKGYGQPLYLFGRKKGSGETVWEIKEKIGYFTSSLTKEFPRLDSIERILLGGFFDSIGLYDTPGDQQVVLAGQWLSLLGLYPVKDKPFRNFPLGQQRMILIARAMIKHPPLLILDEPTAGLDDENAALFIELVNKIAAETTSAIIYVSHRVEEGLKAASTFELTLSSNGSTGLQQKTSADR